MMARTLVAFLLAFNFAAATADAAEARPNILWITSEDHGPHLGCYGDPFATTPNVDGLAARGMLYPHCWSNAPVCAAARTTLISGLYGPSSGAEHMRSMAPFPAGKQMFPQLLRAAGYYCTNNAKEDYNLEEPGQVWDVSGRQAHWRNRAQGQPFFAVFNSNKSHESQIRKRPHTAVHDPAKVRVPAYHPDTPEVRQDWAQYYDCVSQADADAGRVLDQLTADGLDRDTIVFYFADHGSGMPRNKRWPYNSGLHVPLVVYIPEAFRELRPSDYEAGGKSERLVSFVDFAPTVLSLAGIAPPDWLQGHAFLGKFAAPPQPFSYGFRGRMDERIDLVRSVTDGRYVYVRNFLPHRIYGQHLNYMFQTPTTRLWHKLHAQGQLNAEQDAFWRAKPVEELYDLAVDPDEVRNLAEQPERGATLARLRQALHDQMRATRDVGLLPEGEMHARAAGESPYDLARDGAKYPLERVLATAELAARRDTASTERLVTLLDDADSAVRYWAAVGLTIREHAGVAAGQSKLAAALGDAAPSVRIAAAEALCRYGDAAHRAGAAETLARLCDWGSNDVFTSLAALNAVDACGDRAAAIRGILAGLPTDGPVPHERYQSYVPRLLQAAP